MMILSGSSYADLVSIAERRRYVVEDTEAVVNSQRIRTTISMGGVSYPKSNAEDFMALISAADEKLYQAKEQGRKWMVV